MNHNQKSKVILLGCVFFLFGLVIPSSGQEKVKVGEEVISIPTYGIKDNPYPIFPTTYWTNDIYHYSLLDSPSLTKSDKKYRLLVIENEFLRVTILLNNNLDFIKPIFEPFGIFTIRALSLNSKKCALDPRDQSQFHLLLRYTSIKINYRKQKC